jgi:hypothetical protein
VKIRTGYVSNSSSSSFVINKQDITAEQRDLIFNHAKIAYILFPADFHPNDVLDEWGIKEDDISVSGFTAMDNFNMERFMERIGVPADKVTFDSEH